MVQTAKPRRPLLGCVFSAEKKASVVARIFNLTAFAQAAGLAEATGRLVGACPLQPGWDPQRLAKEGPKVPPGWEGQQSDTLEPGKRLRNK